mmetsp:Transcript_52444/g.137290  ORF Transcript_52444/g.137290 Transcript_52444/m.137290 type:complete len:337 (-) Transcript_52444:133-1143(-)
MYGCMPVVMDSTRPLLLQQLPPQHESIYFPATGQLEATQSASGILTKRPLTIPSGRRIRSLGSVRMLWELRFTGFYQSMGRWSGEVMLAIFLIFEPRYLHFLIRPCIQGQQFILRCRTQRHALVDGVSWRVQLVVPKPRWTSPPFPVALRRWTLTGLCMLTRSAGYASCRTLWAVEHTCSWRGARSHSGFDWPRYAAARWRPWWPPSWRLRRARCHWGCLPRLARQCFDVLGCGRLSRRGCARRVPLPKLRLEIRSTRRQAVAGNRRRWFHSEQRLMWRRVLKEWKKPQVPMTLLRLEFNFCRHVLSPCCMSSWQYLIETHVDTLVAERPFSKLVD